MKIAVLGIRGLPANYGGFETCTDHISKHWTEQGHDVLVFCRKNRYKTRPKHYGGVKLCYVASINAKSLDTISHTFLSAIRLIFFYPGFKYVHLYNTGNALIIPLLRWAGKKVIISVDGIEWKREKWGWAGKTMHKLGEIVARKYAHKIITDNQVVSQYYLDHRQVNTVMIPYGAKITTRKPLLSEEILEKFQLQANGYFLFVGRLVPEKGVHHLIASYKKLKTEFPLVIIGDDQHTDYRNQLFSEASDRIRFLGYLYGDEYEQLLVNALIYVSASEMEGTSPSLLAAMGGHVCALVNGIEENRATAGDSVYYFEKNNYEDLTTRWQTIANDPKRISEMAKTGYAYVQTHYNWQSIANRYLEVFESL
ncbi:MAG: DUF1972 domain-containing protein [Flavobacteriales bacterium]|nr:DUF1972 domain-containing protein [Flavobacteriales bacterium]